MQLGKINEDSYEHLAGIISQYAFDQVQDYVKLNELEEGAEKERMTNLILKTIQVSLSIASEFCEEDYLNLDKMHQVYKLMEDGDFEQAHEVMSAQ